MPGVSIGNHVIIAAGSVVTKSFPDNVVIAGNPANVISSIDNYIQKNLPYNLNTKGLTPPEKKDVLLSISEEYLIKK